MQFTPCWYQCLLLQRYQHRYLHTWSYEMPILVSMFYRDVHSSFNVATKYPSWHICIDWVFHPGIHVETKMSIPVFMFEQNVRNSQQSMSCYDNKGDQSLWDVIMYFNLVFFLLKKYAIKVMLFSKSEKHVTSL